MSKVGVYFCDWSIYARNYFPKNLPISQISDIYYAFFNVVNNQVVYGDKWADVDIIFPDGKGVLPLGTWSDPPGSHGIIGDLQKLKNQGNKFKVHLSLFGWTWSANASTVFSTASNRTTFVNSIIATLKKYPVFDGVDLDWEYPKNGKNVGNTGNAFSNTDEENFLAGIKELRSALDSNGMSSKQISLAVASNPDNLMQPVVLQEIDKCIVSWNIMTYDFDSSVWGAKLTNHQTNIYPTSYTAFSIDAGVKAYLAAGIPANKLQIGGAAYSRGFANTEGLGKPCSGTVSKMSWEAGVSDYKAILGYGLQESYDSEAQAGYFYDPALKELYSVDTPRSIKAKVDYIKQKGLQGIFFWEASGDSQDDKSLIKTAYESMGGTYTPPVVQPPVTQPPVVVPPVVVPPVTQPPVVVPPVVVPPVTQPGIQWQGIVEYQGKNYNCVIYENDTLTLDLVVPPVVGPPVTQPPVVQPPVQGSSTWATGVAYKAGDTVTLNGKTYTCVIPHTSMESWSPSFQSALWK